MGEEGGLGWGSKMDDEGPDKPKGNGAGWEGRDAP